MDPEILEHDIPKEIINIRTYTRNVTYIIYLLIIIAVIVIGALIIIPDLLEEDERPASFSAVRCMNPPPVLHSHQNLMDDLHAFPIGYELIYHCPEGYQQDYNHTLLCNEEGKWVATNEEGKFVATNQINCIPVNCTKPLPIENGWTEGDHFQYNNQITYHCKQNYQLQGNKTLTCAANGNWTGGPPTCTVIDCGWPGPLYNGYLLGEKTTAGSVIFFGCDIKTLFFGEFFDTTCQSDGTWSHPLPQCLGPCQIPSVTHGKLIEQSAVHNDWITHGKELHYECFEGFSSKDSKLIRCNNGTWEPAPGCVRNVTFSLFFN